MAPVGIQPGKHLSEEAAGRWLIQIGPVEGRAGQPLCPCIVGIQVDDGASARTIHQWYHRLLVSLDALAGNEADGRVHLMPGKELPDLREKGDHLLPALRSHRHLDRDRVGLDGMDAPHKVHHVHSLGEGLADLVPAAEDGQRGRHSEPVLLWIRETDGPSRVPFPGFDGAVE
jgi:hypothetical protein